jgi:hypothetical protein
MEGNEKMPWVYLSEHEFLERESKIEVRTT